ncbi:hypothetical protein GQ55_5G341300 [Panicum hallii var. hallii]|uniref:BED-type domain-containing protein n=1 Tax=Panicum hallii var. hallii TaxID=1504633 RepID=A0A2T7DM37_9POAL|nr:hypothetical protein GQ55_5G341300 [Panicum hallii var. hallii]
MDYMEEYTINDDLRTCGLPGDNEDDLASSGETLFGSSAAPINVDGGDDAGAAGGAGAGTPGQSTMPSSSMPSVDTGTSIWGKRMRSGAWNDFEEIFETLPTGKKVRVAPKCRHCSHVLSGRSSASTGHLLQHRRYVLLKLSMLF